jgi:hypothetical protein
MINSKIYIGQCSKEWDKSLTYLGSGKYLKRAILKYGSQYFFKELICKCNSKDEMSKMEKFFINYYNSTNKNIGYNISKGGQGIWSDYKETNINKYNESIRRKY